MAEESRGKRRKQANPRRNQVDIERVSSLGSEGEDEVGLWSLEPLDCQESLDKTSLTPSEGTEEPGSPARFTQTHNWPQVEPETEAEGEFGVSSTPAEDREGDPGSLKMYSKNSDSHNSLEDLAHFEFLTQLRKASNQSGLLEHAIHNGTTSHRHPESSHEDLPPAIWSPGAQTRAPVESGSQPTGLGAVRMQQACPFCNRTYQRGASLREHIKYCQEREVGVMVCPLCGYTATYREQMERHLALHNQLQNQVTMDQGIETRKFKCLQCGKAFKYKHHLKEHLRIHSGEKPYECSNCKKRFSHSGSYSSHLSSKKCLSGGGSSGGGSGGGGTSNGHSHGGAYRHSFPMSPPAGAQRNSNGVGSPFPSQANKDNMKALGRLPESPHPLSPQESPTAFHSASELARLWDPDNEELSLRASGLKGSPLLPYVHPGTRFDRLLQEMLHREVRRDQDRAAMEERRALCNGDGADGKGSPGGRARRGGRPGSGEPARCRWCSQLFPSTAVLLQHERYLCKASREAAEMPEGTRGKPLVFSSLPFHSPSRPNGVTNGLSGDQSPESQSWPPVPRPPLVGEHSPARPVPLRHHWAREESVDASSPQQRRRVPPSGFASPVCVDLSACPPEFPSPQGRTALGKTRWCAEGQVEPLDLSVPKQPSEIRLGGTRNAMGSPASGVKRENQQRMSPTGPTHVPLHRHPLYGGPGGSMFGGNMYNGFSLFRPMVQAGLGFAGHDGMPLMSVSQPASSPGFLPPVAYMSETDTEAMLKKIHQDRQAAMGGLDYLSLMEEGIDAEGGPGRKRLKKTEEGLYACDICEKSFQKSSSLLRHKYEHTGKRPHECKTCKKAFKHKHHLIEHSRLHSGEKPYQCDKCGKRFSHSGSYSQHMNHRYAYCSRDHDPDLDPDQDPEDMPATPGTDADLRARLSGETQLSMEDMRTHQSFLSDSSLDGAPGGLREEVEEDEEEDEDEDEEEEDGDKQEGDGPTAEGDSTLSEAELRLVSPAREHSRNTSGDSLLADSAERPLWDREATGLNRDSETHSLDTSHTP